MNPFQRIISTLLSYEANPKKLALACAVGTYIAFSPFPIPFGHSILVIILSWLLRLNVSATWLVSIAINNPWTMVPVYTLDYGFGYLLVHNYFNLTPSNPAWMGYVNGMLQSYLGMPELCFWSFMIGGNLLGIMIGAMLYPVSYYVFKRLVKAESAVL